MNDGSLAASYWREVDRPRSRLNIRLERGRIVGAWIG